eukprot:5483538-Prorocentrum_lima.AAC.1
MGRSQFSAWQDQVGRLRPSIAKLPAVTAISLDGYRCSVMTKSDEDRASTANTIRQQIIKDGLQIIVLTIPGSAMEMIRLAASQCHRA